PVGICVAINGNKAMVRSREEQSKKWSASERWELPQLMQRLNHESHSFEIKLWQGWVSNRFEYHYTELPSTFEEESDFVRQLNDWLITSNGGVYGYSAEIVDKNTDSPVLQDPAQYRIIVNASFTANVHVSHEWQPFYMVDSKLAIQGTRAIGKPVKAINWYYKNNGFKTNCIGGCCRAMYYDAVQKWQNAPTSAMENINIVPGGRYYSDFPVRLVDFNDNDNCKILRDNFANYDEYLESCMIKFPCGAGGVIAETPSGKENTYKLANCTFLDNKKTGKQEILYPAANWAASIDVNAPKLGKGNWWLPSAAEMSQMMRDVTYDTSFWATNPDIVNRVLEKLTSIDDSGWSMLSASTSRWTSSRYDQHSVYYYLGSSGNNSSGNLYCYNFCYDLPVAPITIYEF
ncbi:MAG: hypothetical protein SOZ72_09975, partial [Treponema sp.]|nr:hypothetical protein [Treponema sp.]